MRSHLIPALLLATGLPGPAELPLASAQTPQSPPAAVTSEPPSTRPAAATPLFDPARHMRVTEVRPGMKGYGLTVFQGTKIERFDVEVVSVVRNFNAGFDAVFVMAQGDRMRHLGGVEGMSGSPIYLFDASGKPRLIGAYAYGFPLSKDPIVGVQPIEYMLDIADPLGRRATPLPRTIADGDPTHPPAGPTATPRLTSPKVRWVHPLARSTSPSPHPAAALTPRPPSPSPFSGLAITVSGMSAQTLTRIQPLLASAGLRPNTSTEDPPPTLPTSPPTVLPMSTTRPTAETLPPEYRDLPTRIEPGSSLVVPLMTGDADFIATGTCTEVIGDRVFGFGHPYLGEGAVELPMAAGYVNTIVANLAASFKVAGYTRSLGTLRTDTQVGVGGTLGVTARTIPMTVRVIHADGSLDRTYHYDLARHAQLTPVLAAIGSAGSIAAIQNLPAKQTLRLQSRLQFPGQREINIDRLFAGPNIMEVASELLTPLATVADTPFGQLFPDAITTTVTIAPEMRAADLTSARPLKSHYAPGETARIALRYQPFGASETARVIDLPLPKDLPPGDYTVTLSDITSFLSDEVTARPDRFVAEDLDSLFKTVATFTALGTDKLYVRLKASETAPASSGPTQAGLAVGPVFLPSLPGSRRQLLLNGARADVMTTHRSITQETNMPFVVRGSAETTLTIADPTSPNPRPKQTGTTDPAPSTIPPARSGKRPLPVPGTEPDAPPPSGPPSPLPPG